MSPPSPSPLPPSPPPLSSPAAPSRRRRCRRVSVLPCLLAAAAAAAATTASPFSSSSSSSQSSPVASAFSPPPPAAAAARRRFRPAVSPLTSSSSSSSSTATPSLSLSLFPRAGTEAEKAESDVASRASFASAAAERERKSGGKAPTPTTPSSSPPGVGNDVVGSGMDAALVLEDTDGEVENGDADVVSFLKERLFLGIEPTPEIAAIMTIYFVEGALGLARLAQTFLLKDTLHLGPAEMSALTGAFALPWTIKPLYGFLSDGFPLFGYRRRSYLVLAGMVGALSYSALGADFWGLLSDPSAATVAGEAVGGGAVEAMAGAAGEVATTAAEVATGAAVTAAAAAVGAPNLRWTVAALLLSSACIAVSDVVADGIVVQRTRESDDPKVAGGLQSLCWGSAALGGLITAYLSGSLLEAVGPRRVFAMTAALPLMVATIATLIDEKPVVADKGEGAESSPLVGVKDQMDGLWSAVRQPAIWKPALFLFLWQSTPTGEGAMLYFMTNDLGFGPEFLGRVRLITAISSLGGVWAYQKYLRTVPIKDILFWTSIASAPLGLSQLLLISHANRSLGIPDGAFVFGDDVALSILGELAFLPTLVLAARLCPPGVEAVLFATLMSVFNGASTVGTELGAALTKYLGVTESNFDNLWLLNVICNVSSLYPLLFIGWLDGVGSKGEEEMEGTAALEGDVVLDVAAMPDGKEGR